jgi:ABC-type nitrate/sulfonate/bicarbonate transport system permease component
MRSGFAFCWRSLLGAEMVIGVARAGLGASLGASRRVDDLPTMLLALALMVVVAMLLDRLLLARVERAVHRRFALHG